MSRLSKAKQVSQDEIAHLISEGFTKKEIAKMLDISTATVSKVVGTRKRVIFTEDMVSDLTAKANDGWTNHQLAEYFDVHVNTIINWRKKLGLMMRPRNRSGHEDKKMICPAQKEKPIIACNVEQNGLYLLEGIHFIYRIDFKSGLVHVYSKDDAYICDFFKDNLFYMERELISLYNLIQAHQTATKTFS